MKRRRAAVLCVLCLAALALPAGLHAEPDWDAVHPLGLAPTEAGALARALDRGRPPDAPLTPADLPSRHVNFEHLPAVRAQLLANCGAYAPTYYYKTWQEAKEHGWLRPDPEVDPEHVMSPGFTFPLVNAGLNAGASIGGVMDVFTTFGCATWADMPESGEFTALPADHVWRKAALYRGGSWTGMDAASPEGIAALKEHLAVKRDLAVVGLPVYTGGLDLYDGGTGPGFDSGVVHGPGIGIKRGDHAFTLIGYDDTMTYDDGTGPKQGAWLAVNSWGQGWGATVPEVGTGGFVWIGYDYFAAASGGAFVMSDRVGYQPLLFATYGIEHEARNNLVVTLFGGDLAAPDWQTPNVFPIGSGARPYAGRVAVDLTDYLDSPAGTEIWLRVFDNRNFPPITGTVTSFSVDGPGGTQLISDDAPAATLDMDSVFLRIGDANLRRAAPELGGLSFGGGAAQGWGDYDGDGDPDLALCGWDLARRYDFTRVLRNDGGALADVVAGLPGFHSCALAWADADNDGDLDLAVCGESLSAGGPAATVFRNDDGAFTDARAGIAGLAACSLAWGDYDNDGRLDLALTGRPAGGTSGATRLYRNNAGGTFSDTRIALPGAGGGGLPWPGSAGGNLAWGDFDADGRADLAVGRDDEIGVQLLRNSGGGAFVSLATFPYAMATLAPADFDADGDLDLGLQGADGGAPATRVLVNDGGLGGAGPALPGTMLGALAWGDQDNDGLADLAFAGRTVWPTSGSARAAHVWLGDGAGGFADLHADLPGVAAGDQAGQALAWVDWDGDADLDLALFGDGAASVVNAVFVNQAAPGHPNTAPAPPAGLQAAPGPKAGELLLTWSAGSDAETPAAGLGYRVRVGTVPGGADVVSPAASPGAAANGFARIAPGVPGILLRGLRDGTYHWNARAVDAGQRESPWSADGSFTIADGMLQ